MKRHILRKLQAWQQAEDRNPLILKGVRQCGKTYSLKHFGETCFEHYFIINFERQRSLHTLFAGDLTPHKILEQLSFALKASINPKTDLVIFDEIQACPNALTSLKYFAEDMPELALCAAGSLLGLELTPTSFPVGKVDFLTLRPMSFAEFLLALEDSHSLNILNHFAPDTRLSDLVHQHLWERFKWYLICGGLPEVVKLFVTLHHNNLYEAFQKVRIKQNALIDAYYADIAKHAGKVNAMHIERVFQAVPAQLAKTQNSRAPRFQFTHIIPGIDRYQRLAGAIDWLNKAGLLISIPIINHIEIPLQAYVKPSLFKLYCFDVGILGAMNQLPPETILNFDFGSYKGYFAENYVAQHLMLETHAGIYCWQQQRSEIEFVKQFKDKIIPIEVKAGAIIKAKSLEKYCNIYQPDTAIILRGTNTPTTNSQYVTYPLYLVEWLNELGNLGNDE